MKLCALVLLNSESEGRSLVTDGRIPEEVY